MRKRVAMILYSILATVAVGACAPIASPALETEAVVCDDAADPDCAPARDVIIEE